MMIEVSGLSKQFGVVKAVDAISFKIAKGEVVGFVGPNGAGKTTTMRILTCFLPADEGEVKVGGHDVIDESMAVRSMIGYLPESAPLYLDMTVDGFLKYIAEVRGIAPADRPNATAKMIETCGLSGVLKKTIGELSKGYRQRVGLAQAMIHDPEILILDEPTVGLDPNQIREIRKLIKKLGQDKTIILSTHILSEVEAACNRVIVINRGKIVADGAVAEVAGSTQDCDVYLILARGEQAAIEGALKTVTDLDSFAFDGRDNGHCRFTASVRRGAQVGEQLSRALADAHLGLAELTREQPSLEAAFVQLTRGRND
jgi:ABC-2 type transport system ATP-binding protein